MSWKLLRLMFIPNSAPSFFLWLLTGGALWLSILWASFELFALAVGLWAAFAVVQGMNEV
jgi:hypothetical protein